MAVGAILLVLATSLIIGWGAAWIAPLVPYSWEPDINLSGNDVKIPEACEQKALESLTDQIVALSDKQLPVTLHWLPDVHEANAFATSGGHIHVTAGLLESISSENALAMVLAHEYAHIELRHPLTMMLQQLGQMLLMSLTGMGSDSSGITQNTSLLANLSFSRGMEKAADSLALELITRKYGHTQGSDEFFENMLKSSKSRSPSFWSTHPNLEDRIDSLRTGSPLNTAEKASLTPLKQCLVKEKSGH